MASYLCNTKYGAPVWSDGVRVPWNYQSALIESSLSYAEKDCNFDFPRKNYLNRMLASFYNSELRKSQTSYVWNYSTGPLHFGWKSSDKVSLNTPAYSGDIRVATTKAHSSYRTMDARAIQLSIRCGLRFIPNVDNFFKNLLARSKVEPNFLASTSRDSKMRLSGFQRDYWGRLTDPWQLSNGVWTTTKYRSNNDFDIFSESP
jgi:hypothetical protein